MPVTPLTLQHYEGGSLQSMTGKMPMLFLLTSKISALAANPPMLDRLHTQLTNSFSAQIQGISSHFSHLALLLRVELADSPARGEYTMSSLPLDHISYKPSQDWIAEDFGNAVRLHSAKLLLYY